MAKKDSKKGASKNTDDIDSVDAFVETLVDKTEEELQEIAKEQFIEIQEKDALIAELNQKNNTMAADVAAGKQPNVIGVHDKVKYKFNIHNFQLKGVKHTSKTAAADPEVMKHLVDINSGVIEPVDAPAK